MKSYNVDTRAITLGLVMIGGILAALALGRAVGNQNYLHIIVVCGFVFGCLFFFTLGDRYWYLIPFALASGLPAIPLGGRTVELGELAIASCTVFFVMRVALKKEHLVIFRATHIPILLFMGWVLLCFSLNPSGFMFFGAQTAGARFYLKLALAFCAFLILASREISENDAKWIIRLLILGVFINLAYGFASFFLLGGAPEPSSPGAIETEDFYSWHQILSLPAITLAFLIFSRYKPSDVIGFQKPWTLLAYCIVFVIALASGKRMGVVAVMIAPFVSAIVYRQRIYIWVGLFALMIFVAVVTLGHGHLFTLPMTMQRAISWLPGQWDADLTGIQAGSDEFREALRRFAVNNIQRDPVIGKGFSVDITETGSAITEAMRGGTIDVQVAAYALGKAWHNTWLGYAADFGIPLSVLQGVLFITVLVVSYRTSSELPYPSSLKTIGVYVLITVSREIMTSYTSGHTALDAFGRWWMYGMIFSIAASVAQRNPQTRTPVKAGTAVNGGAEPQTAIASVS